MNIRQLIEFLQNDTDFTQNVRLWMKTDVVKGTYAPWPDSVDARLVDAYRKRGIEELYSHQRSAFDAASK
ncbi:MAG TPA: hypothetical protein PK986_08815, partial [Spirochaetota bacterium]|nr:hypothetical protein [Spirochaetota bacterium]